MAKKKANKQQRINKNQARFLRGQGHHLSPLAMVGREGITENLQSSVNDNLTAHELVKIKVQNTCPLDRHEVAENLAAATGSALVQLLGKTILLYRENKDLKADAKISLPR